MKILVLSKNSIGQFPLTLTSDLLAEGHEVVCLPLKKMSDAISPDRATDLLAELASAMNFDCILAPNWVLPFASDWRRVKASAAERTLFVYIALDAPINVNHEELIGPVFNVVACCDLDETERLKQERKVPTVFAPPPAPTVFIRAAEKASRFLVSKVTPRPPVFYFTNAYEHERFQKRGAINRAIFLAELSKRVAVDLWGAERVAEAARKRGAENLRYHGVLPYLSIPKAVKGRVTACMHVVPHAPTVSTHFYEQAACGCIQALEDREPFKSLFEKEAADVWETVKYEPGNLEAALKRVIELANLDDEKADRIARTNLKIARAYTTKEFFDRILEAVK